MKTIGLTLAALAFTGTAAFAGGCNWGKHDTAMLAQSEPAEEAQTPLPADNLVAQLTCDGLTGEDLSACLATTPAQ